MYTARVALVAGSANIANCWSNKDKSRARRALLDVLILELSLLPLEVDDDDDGGRGGGREAIMAGRLLLMLLS